MSPGLSPARAAGVPSMGATTISRCPLRVTSRPTPPNSPSVSTFICSYSLGVMKALWGSRVAIIPLMAP